MLDKGSVHVAHILLRLGQKASYQEQEVVERRIDSIYQALCKGADFADLAKKCSDDKGSAVNGGTLAWFTKGQTVQAFEKVAFSLRKGSLSCSDYYGGSVALSDIQRSAPHSLTSGFPI